MLVDVLGQVTNALTSDTAAVGIDTEILESFRTLIRPVGKTIKSAALLFNDTVVELTEQIGDRIDRALAVEEECYGSAEGMLEQINIHREANTFHVYPEVVATKISCEFSKSILDDALYGVGKRVDVFGLLRFRTGSNFPHQIIAERISVFPTDQELPDWEDLRGRAPDTTGGLSSEEFIRELRDAW